MNRPIAIGLSPNTQNDDVRLAVRLLFTPWRYITGNATKELERWFRTHFKVSGAVGFVNARSALYAILHSLGIRNGDEVLLQAFTCVAVPNAVMATGAKPVYVDIDQTLNIDPELLEKRITSHTKAIIIQHTFAVSANIEVIKKIAKTYKLYLIEDCAHTIGGEYKHKKLGTFGIAACFSFGRDKAFSSVSGGMVITSDRTLLQDLRSYEKQKAFPSFLWVMQQLLYNPVSWVILTFYYFFYFGKILHFLLRRIMFFSDPVTSDEKAGVFNTRDVRRLPNALAELALHQVKKYTEYNTTRQKVAAHYAEDLQQEDILYDASVPYLRYPFVVADKTKAKRFFAKKGIFVGDWYRNPIDPQGVNVEKIHYVAGSCPRAEALAKSMINLPTYPAMKREDWEKVIAVMETYRKEEAKAI